MRRISILITIVVLAAGCEDKHDLVRTFRIRKGEHFSTPRLVETLQSKTLVFEAKFNSSAQYYFNKSGFQDSKNKLMGFSDCNCSHQQNSARFAWQWYNDRLEIFAYCYVDGVRTEAFVGVVNIGEFNRYTISITPEHYVFSLNGGSPVLINRDEKCNTGLYYKLWPYFGGTLPAPHDITIDIKEN